METRKSEMHGEFNCLESSKEEKDWIREEENQSFLAELEEIGNAYEISRRQRSMFMWIEQEDK